MDLRKIFDIVNHSSIFQALGYHGLQPPYIALLQKLYSSQTGSIGNSKVFDILCGVKQGDILSALLFNCVLDIAFEDWKTQLRDEGILVENTRHSERLTNTRYADDVLIYAKSLKELEHMTELLVVELRKVGLTLNTKKTKILHSSDADEGAGTDFALIDDDFVQIPHADQSHRYLGR